MEPGAKLRAVGRYGLLYGGGTAVVVTGLVGTERAAAAAFVAGLAVVLVVGGLGDVRTGAGPTDDPEDRAVVDTSVDVRTHTPVGRKALLYGIGLAATGFAAMVVLGSVV